MQLTGGGARLFALASIALALATGCPASGPDEAGGEAAPLSAAEQSERDSLYALGSWLARNLYGIKLAPQDMAPLAEGPLNVNADEAAAALALGLGADRIVFVSDVPGLLRSGEVVPVIAVPEADRLLDSGELEGGMSVVWSLAAQGIAVILVEHVMTAVRALCSRVVVMNAGLKIAEGPPDEVLRDAEVIRAYLGDDDARGA